MMDLQVHLLGGDQREALAQVEAHLVAEHAARAGAGAVGLGDAVVAHVAHEVFVLRADRALGARLRDGVEGWHAGIIGTPCRGGAQPWRARLAQEDLDAAVLGPAGFAGVVGDRLARAAAHGLDRVAGTPRPTR